MLHIQIADGFVQFLGIVGRDDEHLGGLKVEALANDLDQRAAVHARHHPVDKRH